MHRRIQRTISSVESEVTSEVGQYDAVLEDTSPCIVWLPSSSTQLTQEA